MSARTLKFAILNRGAAACALVLLLVVVSPAQEKQSAAGPDQAAVCTDLEGKIEACPERQTPAEGSERIRRKPSLPRDIVADQISFWKTPLRWRERDAQWILPFTLMTGGIIASDNYIQRQTPQNLSLINRSAQFSDYGLAAMAGLAGGAYVWGGIRGHEGLRETGLLSGEAVASTLLVVEPIKYLAGRERPLEDNRRGRFRSGGVSFPSEHSAAAWAIASVVTREYPGPLSNLLAYGAATGISAARVIGQKHFASDALIGAALGWYMGRQVFEARHDRDADVASWGTFEVAKEDDVRGPENMGSPYVPIDSWVYPVLDRFAALGHVPSALAGLRPWTRLECARLVAEAGNSLDDSPDRALSQAYKALTTEFAPEIRQLDGGKNLAVSLDSIYSRATVIGGTPLRDSYHFMQTVANDFGRPYGEGVNGLVGVTSHAVAGPLSFYIRGEYQHAASLPQNSLAARSAIITRDLAPLPVPFVPDFAQLAVNRFDPVEAYASLTVEGWQFSIGKQSLWWGPAAGGAFLASNNSEPILMLRASRPSPMWLPGPFRLMGPVRTEFFIGRLSGHNFVYAEPTLFSGTPKPQPYVEGQKISFKPTPNLEFGFSITAMISGPGMPLTLRTVLRSLGPTNGVPGSPNDPGDRRTGFDFTYRIPGLRDRVVLYNDSLADDEFSPIAYPRRSAMNPGIYLPQLPLLPKVDFRAEAVYTNLPGMRPTGFFYTNDRYRSGYTNDGNLIGHWIGREGRAVQLRSTYWHSARTKVQFGYRNGLVDQEFLRGGTYSDFSLGLDIPLRPEIALSSTAQYERWKFPLLRASPQTNGSISVQLTYTPRIGIRR